jgi:hypothetical protein
VEDQDFLDHVFGEGTICGQHAREAQHTGQPGDRELLECHRASIVGISSQETHPGHRNAVRPATLMCPPGQFEGLAPHPMPSASASRAFKK